MYKIFGLVSISTPTLVSIIKRLKPKTKLFINGVGDIRTSRYALLSNVNYVKKHADDLIDSDCVVFVSDCFLNLSSIKDIDILDGKVTATFQSQFLNITDDAIKYLLDDRTKYGNKKILFKKVSIAAKLLRSTPESIMSTIYTFLYKIPNKDRREYARQHILHWLHSPDVDYEDFSNLLKFRGKQGEFLNNFLQSESVDNFRSLFADGVNVSVKLSEFGLSEFDYSYISKFSDS